MLKDDYTQVSLDIAYDRSPLVRPIYIVCIPLLCRLLICSNEAFSVKHTSFKEDRRTCSYGSWVSITAAVGPTMALDPSGNRETSNAELALILQGSSGENHVWLTGCDRDESASPPALGHL